MCIGQGTVCTHSHLYRRAVQTGSRAWQSPALGDTGWRILRSQAPGKPCTRLPTRFQCSSNRHPPCTCQAGGFHRHPHPGAGNTAPGSHLCLSCQSSVLGLHAYWNHRSCVALAPGQVPGCGFQFLRVQGRGLQRQAAVGTLGYTVSGIHQNPVEDTALAMNQLPSTCPCHSSTVCECSGQGGLQHTDP